MTTSERLRRRQRRLGIFILLLAIFTVGQASFFTIRDRAQNECFRGRFADLTEVLDIRADLTQQETAATDRVLSVWAEAAHLVEGEGDPKLSPRQQKRVNRELTDALLAYDRTSERIEKQREENPVPPYPAGTCGKG